MIDPESLKTFLDLLVKDPALVKSGDETFCNIGVHRAATLFGATCFNRANGTPMIAREIILAVEASPSTWLTCSGRQACDYALRGGWAIAYMKVMLSHEGKLTVIRAPHDHVATVYPAALQRSLSLNKDVPLVANIGEKNRVERSSEAFPVLQGEASYAIYV